MPVPGENPIRPEVREQMNAIAKVIDGAINGEVTPDKPKKYGFALLVFDFGSGGYMNYVSNTQRADMVKAMKEFIHRNEAPRRN